MARRRLGFNTLRVFLHSLVYEGDGASVLISRMDRFLAMAHANNLTVGFVFFGDCFNGAGWVSRGQDEADVD